jgi:hypothetical protein
MTASSPRTLCDRQQNTVFAGEIPLQLHGVVRSEDDRDIEPERRHLENMRAGDAVAGRSPNDRFGSIVLKKSDLLGF